MWVKGASRFEGGLLCFIESVYLARDGIYGLSGCLKLILNELKISSKGEGLIENVKSD
jgi:hypothetical protein